MFLRTWCIVPQAKGRVTHYFCEVENILEKEIPALYPNTPIIYKYSGKQLLINGHHYGNKGTFTDPRNKKKFKGIEIIEDFKIGNNVILEKGTIFNAPFCRFEMNWQKEKSYYLKWVLIFFPIGILYFLLILFFRGHLVFLDNSQYTHPLPAREPEAHRAVSDAG